MTKQKNSGAGAAPGSKVPKGLAPFVFPPGKSGNPGGRPKGSVSLSTIYHRVMTGEDYWIVHGTAGIKAIESGLTLEELPEQTQADVKKLQKHPKVLAYLIVGEWALRSRHSLDDLKEGLNRTEGKVRDVLEIEETTEKTPDEIRRRRAEIAKRKGLVEEGRQ